MGADIGLMTGARTENIGGLDLNLPERQSMEGYVPSFLTCYRNTQSLNLNTGVSTNDRRIAVIDSVLFNVALITEIELRQNLWKWFEEETEKEFKKDPDMPTDLRIQKQFKLATQLQGKIIDYIGRFLTKPLEIGTE